MSVLSQTKELNSLLDKAVSLASDGDRVAYALKGSTIFRAGEYTASEAVLSVPKDADFMGYSLNVFLQGRVISPTNPTNSERTFRPATFTWENPSVSQQQDLLGNADFRFELRDSTQGNYQNAPIYSASLFSSMSDLTLIPKMPTISSWQGSLQFSVPYYIPRGETVTARLTPVDSRPDDPALNDDRREYRLVCILQGYKLVHAFR